VNKKTGSIYSFVLMLLWMLACIASPAIPVPTSAALVPTNASAAPPSTASVIAAVSTQSSSSPTVRPGTYFETIPSGGQQREYIIHIPPSYNGLTAMPLVFVLHGVGGSDRQMEGSGMSLKADQENFIVVYPNGTGDPRGFNDLIFPQPITTVDDIGFFRDMISRFEQRLHVDPKRIYAAGFSNGAIFTYQLGAELTDQFAAIAIVEGTIGTHEGGSSLVIPQPSGPLPVIIFHGEKDATVPYNGGLSVGLLKLNFFSVGDALAFWNKNDGCTQPPTKQTLYNGKVLTEDFLGCTAGSEVLLYTIVNGVHEWPTLNDQAGFSGTDAIWDFFSKHTR